MTDSKTADKKDLNSWLTRAIDCNNVKELFSLLKDFRQEDWTDTERSAMSRMYMRVLGDMTPADTAMPVVEDKGPDGPVWYEKM